MRLYIYVHIVFRNTIIYLLAPRVSGGMINDRQLFVMDWHCCPSVSLSLPDKAALLFHYFSPWAFWFQLHAAILCPTIGMVLICMHPSATKPKPFSHPPHQVLSIDFTSLVMTEETSYIMIKLASPCPDCLLILAN